MAGLLRDAGGRVLVTQRMPGRHLAGWWEFPGGKLERSEPQRNALARELAEELGIVVRAARPLIELHHRYAERAVVLHAWMVERYDGEPSGREGQPLQWCTLQQLAGIELLEADRPVLAALALPDRYLITGEPAQDRAAFLQRLEHALAGGIELVQLRAPALAPGELAALAPAVAARCRAHGARLLVNGDPQQVAALALDAGAHGVHVPARYLHVLADWVRPRGLSIGASCHDAAELAAARAVADFAVLGPVRTTPSHPGIPAMGWERFARLARGAGLPVYALGGVGTEDLAGAWAAGAQGIAAIRSLWECAAP